MLSSCSAKCMVLQVNTFLLGIIAVQVLACLIGAGLDQHFLDTFAPSAWYLQSTSALVGADDFALRALTYFLLTAQFIPISLYVSIRIARQAQQVVMQLDRAMAYQLPSTALATATLAATAGTASASSTASGAAATAAVRSTSRFAAPSPLSPSNPATLNIASQFLVALTAASSLGSAGASASLHSPAPSKVC